MQGVWPWGMGFLDVRRYLYSRMLEDHSETIFLTDKLDDSIKQVNIHHHGPYYRIKYLILDSSILTTFKEGEKKRRK